MIYEVQITEHRTYLRCVIARTEKKALSKALGRSGRHHKKAKILRVLDGGLEASEVESERLEFQS